MAIQQVTPDGGRHRRSAKRVRTQPLKPSRAGGGNGRQRIRLEPDLSIEKPYPKAIRGVTQSMWDRRSHDQDSVRTLQRLGALGSLTFPDGPECAWYYWDAPAVGMVAPSGVVALADQLRVPRSEISFHVNIFEFFQEDGSDGKSHTTPAHLPVDGPTYAGAWVRECNQRNRWGVKKWILGCDEALLLNRQQGLVALDYSDAFLAYAESMKKVDPEIKIGLALSSKNERWNVSVLKEVGKYADFFALTYYPLSLKSGDHLSLMDAAPEWIGASKAAVDKVIMSTGLEPKLSVVGWNGLEDEKASALEGPALACYVADLLGQLAWHQITQASFSALAQKIGGNDTGLLRESTREPRAAFYGFRAWAEPAERMFGIEASEEVGAYLTEKKGTYHLVLINRSDRDLSIELDLEKLEGIGGDSFSGRRVGAVGPSGRVAETGFTVLRSGPNLTWTLPQSSVDTLDFLPEGGS